MNILIACEFSGIVREAFRKRGHNAWSCDLLPTEIPGQHIQDDILKHLEGWDLMIAHPPCTYLTLTGNKWFKPEYRERFPNRQEDREDAVRFFMEFANANVPKICIENPLGVMSTRWRKPDQLIQPYQFGHTEAKLTCLWLKNLPLLRYGQGGQLMFGEKLPPELTEIKEPEYITLKSGKRMAKWYVEAASQSNRADIRSKTFQGIANAMAEQWGNEVD